MKIIFLVLAVTFAIVSSEPEPGIKDGRQPPPYINRPKPPSNPLRFRRSPDPQGSIVLQGQKPLSGPERRPTWNLDYQHNIYEAKNGQISAGGGALKLPGQHVQPHIGIQGTWRFRRSPDPQGSIVLQGQKPLSGPERRPTWNLDYQHNIYEGKNGQISAGGGALKLPGQHVQPHIGIQGTWRFRRSPDPQGSIVLQGQKPLSKNGQISAGGGALKLPGQHVQPHIGIQGTWRFRRSPDPQGSIVLQGQKPLSGPERRPTWNLDYQHNIYEGKNGQISAGGGALKLPGQHVQPHLGVQGTWRFRRSPDPQGSIVLQGQKPLSGPERRPTWNLDYQHNIYEGKNGQISAGGGALKLPGQHVQPHIGIQGTWRFRRSPDPQGSIVLQGQKPLSGPERRPTWNLDYQHNIYEGKNGQISAGGGALKLPGQHVQPHIGIQGTWRFRRSPDPQGSIVLQGQKPLSGPERRPTWNLDYQHNIYEGKNGQISAGGGALKLPGQHVQPHIGVQGTWRFRRSPDPQGSIVLQGQKPLSGPERRPTWNLDYQHKIYEGKNGQISAGGGALKLPGQHVQPHIGVQGTWRF
ncbi:hypothetical protein KQX54_006269 [Cotesia glomerata]|uniref:Uncharacterized protein n=1 Tax=Cotesia glomerata TaxID=32391 RepID=A0AAV7HU45_COTGL|nr:hypothetical protein KQX54_006269 [Cotesia glomerata]